MGWSMFRSNNSVDCSGWGILGICSVICGCEFAESWVSSHDDHTQHHICWRVSSKRPDFDVWSESHSQVDCELALCDFCLIKFWMDCVFTPSVCESQFWCSSHVVLLKVRVVLVGANFSKHRPTQWCRAGTSELQTPSSFKISDCAIRTWHPDWLWICSLRFLLDQFLDGLCFYFFDVWVTFLMFFTCVFLTCRFAQGPFCFCGCQFEPTHIVTRGNRALKFAVWSRVRTHIW